MLLRELSTRAPLEFRTRQRKYQKDKRRVRVPLSFADPLSPLPAEIPRVPRGSPRKRDTAAIYKANRLVIVGVLITAAKKCP